MTCFLRTACPNRDENFANKIWNAFRLVKSWNVDETIDQPDSSVIAVKWMDEVLKKSINEIRCELQEIQDIRSFDDHI